MKKVIKKILIVLLAAFVVIQFFGPEKNAAQQLSANDISRQLTIPADVQNILSKACYDCHSNNTKYPWYSQVQPVAWWLNDHIKEGKRHLNFSEFNAYSLRKQYHKLDEVVGEVKEGAMPLESYTIIHTDAKLSDDEKRKLAGWASAAMQTMKAKYPPDSLERKR